MGFYYYYSVVVCSSILLFFLCKQKCDDCIGNSATGALLCFPFLSFPCTLQYKKKRIKRKTVELKNRIHRLPPASPRFAIRRRRRRRLILRLQKHYLVPQGMKKKREIINVLLLCCSVLSLYSVE